MHSEPMHEPPPTLTLPTTRCAHGGREWPALTLGFGERRERRAPPSPHEPWVPVSWRRCLQGEWWGGYGWGKRRDRLPPEMQPQMCVSPSAFAWTSGGGRDEPG